MKAVFFICFFNRTGWVRTYGIASFEFFDRIGFAKLENMVIRCLTAGKVNTKDLEKK